MDESNGNGVYASKSNNSAAAAATTTANNTNNINNIMNAAAVATATMTTTTLPTSVSNEDLSQSLSEYTDADESISAPTEFLAEVNKLQMWYLIELVHKYIITSINLADIFLTYKNWLHLLVKIMLRCYHIIQGVCRSGFLLYLDAILIVHI